MHSILTCFVQLTRLVIHKSRHSQAELPEPRNVDDEVAFPATAVVEIIKGKTRTYYNSTFSPIAGTEAPTSKPAPVIAVRKPTHPFLGDDHENLSLSANSLKPIAPLPLSRQTSSASSQRSRADSKESTFIHQLREQLQNARVECLRPAHCFVIPQCVQEKLITVPTISMDIQAHSPGLEIAKAGAYAKKAYDRARKLYATLAYIKKGEDICPLLDEGITDKDLPFLRKAHGRSKFALFRKNGGPINTLQNWEDKYLEKFDRFQWWMTAPVFKAGRHHVLDEKTILPFVPLDSTDEMLRTKHGGYSEVYPVRIHPAHHEFWPTQASTDNEPLVAVKALHSSDKIEFEKERSILEALGPKNHPHLIKLLATYVQEDKYHLMFPFANANLRRYWDDNPKPDFDKQTVLWSLEQMTGISNGLLLIHNFKVTVPLEIPGAGNIRMSGGDVELRVRRGEQWFGRHGDIKPENILWFDSNGSGDHPMGVLQIADFGLGRFHGRESRSRVNPDTVPTSPTYEPPECKLRRPVSRAYDLWSLGCIYLEFITWLLKGSAEIEDFSNFRGRVAPDTGIDDDNFYTICTDGESPKAVVREQVKAWSDALHAHERCSKMIHDVLDMIMGGLLVVESENRYKANVLFFQLNACLKIAKEDTEYLLAPALRQPSMGSGRSNSTPSVLNAPKINDKDTSKIVLNQEKMVPLQSQFNRHVQPARPRDLVLRNEGTPSFRAKGVGHHGTWPVDTHRAREDLK